MVAPLRIVVWNANMAVHRKLDALASLRPDVAIIPECANSPILTAKSKQGPLNMAWVGRNPNKSLAVMAFGDYSVELMAEYDDRLEWIAPTTISGPHAFMLIGAWCMNHRASQTHPWTPPTRQIEPALDLYQAPIRPDAVVVAGDLNDSVVWDKPRGKIKFADTVMSVGGAGLVSAYHAERGVDFGEELERTLYWLTRSEDGRKYHIDYCFIPQSWVSVLI